MKSWSLIIQFHLFSGKPLGLLGDASSKLDYLAYYFHVTLHRHRLYVFKFLVCEAISLVNVFTQTVYMNHFFGGVFGDHGFSVLAFGDEDRDDPMIDIFPRVIKCQFRRFSSSGSLVNSTATCTLPVNVLSEKMVCILWFWFAALSLVTVVYLVAWCVVFLQKDAPYIMLEPEVKVKKNPDI